MVQNFKAILGKVVGNEWRPLLLAPRVLTTAHQLPPTWRTASKSYLLGHDV